MHTHNLALVCRVWCGREQPAHVGYSWCRGSLRLAHSRRSFAAIGEAVGLLLASATASMVAVALLSLAMYALLMAALGLVMLYMFDNSCYGLHYFVGVSDRNASDSSRGKSVWQVRDGPHDRPRVSSVLQKIACTRGAQWAEMHEAQLSTYVNTRHDVVSSVPCRVLASVGRPVPTS